MSRCNKPNSARNYCCHDTTQALHFLAPEQPEPQAASQVRYGGWRKSCNISETVISGVYPK